MAHRKTCFVLLFLAFLLACASCSNPQDEDRKSSFQLEKTYREVMQGSTLRVFITSGSGDLQISNSDAFKDYARIAYERTPEQTGHVGVLSIQALQVGEFQVSLTDNLTKESRHLTVKVLPSYLLLEIREGSDPDERLIRNIQRDTIDRGRTVSMVVDRYLEVLKPMHEQFIEPTKRYANVIIPQGGENVKGINILCKYIEGLMPKN